MIKHEVHERRSGEGGGRKETQTGATQQGISGKSKGLKSKVVENRHSRNEAIKKLGARVRN